MKYLLQEFINYRKNILNNSKYSNSEKEDSKDQEKSFLDFLEINKFKNIILNKKLTTENRLLHFLKFKNINSFSYQPNNTQRSPDFYVSYNNNFYKVELKSKKQGIDKIMFNSGLPEHDAMYIIENRETKNIIIKDGIDIMPVEEKEELNKFRNDVSKTYEQKYNDFKIKNPNTKLCGLYMRPAYTFDFT